MKEIIVILDDIRSTHNVGSILRSCDGFGISTVYACGYTPFPKVPNDSRLPHEQAKLHNAIAKTALGAEETVSVISGQSVAEVVATKRQLGYCIAALEQSESSIRLPDYTAPDKLALIVGNEVSGISTTNLGLCDVILEIPMIGTKESFNVSVATAIALYQLTT
jgi:tRNA G18 (ribose-2'-O)-methylase SpoU